MQACKRPTSLPRAQPGRHLVAVALAVPAKHLLPPPVPLRIPQWPPLRLVELGIDAGTVQLYGDGRSPSGKTVQDDLLNWQHLSVTLGKTAVVRAEVRCATIVRSHAMTRDMPACLPASQPASLPASVFVFSHRLTGSLSSSLPCLPASWAPCNPRSPASLTPRSPFLFRARLPACPLQCCLYLPA